MIPYELYTDGSCLGNPGSGGWAAIIVCPNGGGESVLRGNSKGEIVTNNQMEMTAVIEGLEFIPPDSSVRVYTDSKYITECFNKHWYRKWMENNWRKSDNKPVLNAELWKTLLTYLVTHTIVSWNWVRGHSGHPYNERCDKLAQLEADRGRKQQ